MTTFKLKYVQSFEDRHGHPRNYFRRGNFHRTLPGLPGSTEFREAYEAALAESEPTKQAAKKEPARAGTFAALAVVYFGSPGYKKLAPSTRANYRRLIDHFCEEHGHRRVAQMRYEHMVSIVGKMSDRPGAANSLLKRVRTLLEFSRKLGWIQHNPASGVDTYESIEIHTWTEGEIEQFEERWPVGTRQRLAFDILLYTGQRGSDAAPMMRPDRAGKIRVIQQKTKTQLAIPVHPNLLRSLEETDTQNRDTQKQAVMLSTMYGQPFSVKGFGQFISPAIRAAKLPERCVAHGLRKAAARRLAEVDCTPHQIMAITGHKTLAEVERYTRAVEQMRLAEQAMAKQVENERLSTQQGPDRQPH